MANSNKPIFARACPSICKIVETYSYKQTISRNPSKEPGDRPSGKMEIVTPYDGHKYFPRETCEDVRNQVKNIKSKKIDAQIGHLVLSNYSKTDIDIKTIPGFIDHYDSLPLKVPVRGNDIPNTELLCDDRYSAVIKHQYLPPWPEVIPINVDMELFDEDQLSVYDLKQLNERLLDVTKEITHQVSFKNKLHLLMNVKIDLPGELELVPDDLSPRIVNMSINWPTVTSFKRLNLIEIKNNEGDYETVPFRYNPAVPCLEWKNISLETEKSAGNNFKTYQSQPMILEIGQPGELYRQRELNARVEIEIPGLLLSGMKARLFNTVGELVHNTAPELTTKLIVDTRMILDDAFARRTFYPCMHLHFDEVIPDDMRLADIKTTLNDRGFNIDSEINIQENNPKGLRWFIMASRHEGPNPMYFRIIVDGKRFETERQVQVQGGQTYTSILESGLMKIYIRGGLKGDNRALTREMNIIQTTLHDRFERIKAKH